MTHKIQNFYNFIPVNPKYKFSSQNMATYRFDYMNLYRVYIQLSLETPRLDEIVMKACHMNLN